MWVGNKIYFLSDRNGPRTLFRHDLKTREVRQVVENHGMDLKSASAGPDCSVYEQFGSLFLFDPATNRWTAAAKLGHPRGGQTATPLPDGSVLVVGGKDNSQVVASAERYDPASNRWTLASIGTLK